MENNEKVQEQKILVLIDFSKSSYQALKYTISLAKAIGGKISLLYVASPENLVKSDNPSVALRAIEEANIKSEARLKSIVEMIESEGVIADYTNTAGNTSAQLELISNKLQPTLTVVGKGNSSTNQLSEVTQALLYLNENNLLVVGDEFEFNEQTKISIECTGENLKNHSSELITLLNKKTKAGLNVLTSKTKRSLSKFQFPIGWEELSETPVKICYKNNQNFSAANSLIQHIADEEIELVCIERKQRNKSFFAKLFNQSNPTTEFIKNAHIPTLIMGVN